MEKKHDGRGLMEEEVWERKNALLLLLCAVGSQLAT